MRQYFFGLCTTTASLVAIALALGSNIASPAAFAQTATPSPTASPTTRMGDGQRPPRPPRPRPANPPTADGQASPDNSQNPRPRPPRMRDGQRPPHPPRQRPANPSEEQENQPPTTQPTNTTPS